MIWWLVGVAYGIVVVGAMYINSQLPVTLPLALLRSIVWPIWLTTGWPHGQRMPMD